MFADDLKIYTIFDPTDESSLLSSHSVLSDAIHNLSNWFKEWQLELSTTKCSVFYIGRCNPKRSYFLDGRILNKVTETVRDLGLYLSPDLKSSGHCNLLKVKAMQRAYCLLKALRTNSMCTLVNAYKMYVRPILESASTTFNPVLARDNNKLDKVQNYVTRMIFCRCYPDKNYPRSMPDPDYRNLRLGLESLAVRRKRSDLIMCYRILNGLVYVSRDKFYTFYRCRTRGAKLKLRVPKVLTLVRQNAFSVRTAKLFSKLPLDIQLSTSLNCFKNKLIKFDVSGL